MKLVPAVLAALMLIACSGCGDTHESLTGEGVATMKQIVTVLDGVKDEASAKSASPKLKALMEQLNSINERQAKLGTPTEAEFTALESKYGKEMEELQQKMVGNMFRIMADPKINAVLNDLDASMRKNMK